MEEKNIIVDTEILEGTPEEAVMEVAVNEVNSSTGAIMLLSGVVIGGLAIGAVALYKHIKKRKAAKEVDVDCDNLTPDPAEDSGDRNDTDIEG